MTIYLSLSEILKQASEKKNNKEKEEFLKANESKQLKMVLKCIYDKEVEFLLPDSTPPFTANEAQDNDMVLYREMRKIPYFVKGRDGENLTQLQREELFLAMLENVYVDDAYLLIRMIKKEKIDSISTQLVKKVFPDVFVNASKPPTN